MYTITFRDGSKLEGLTLNGIEFQRKEPYVRSEIETKMRNITIESDNPEETYLVGTHKLLHYGGIYHDPVNNHWSLMLMLPSDREIYEMEREQLRADLVYIGMMIGVDIDE